MPTTEPPRAGAVRVLGRAVLGALVATLLAGCGGGTAAPSSGTGPSSSPPGPATLDDPLGTGPLETGALPDDLYDTDVVLLRDAVLDEVRAAGGVRSTVTGSSYEVQVDLAPGTRPDGPWARRFAWSEGGTDREQLQLPGGRACLNLAAGEAVEQQGNGAQGWIEPSDLPWSCTRPDDALGTFVTSGPATFDPVSRLLGLQGVTSLTDLGVETGTGAGGPTRHVRVDGTEMTVPTREVATSFDLWLDGDLRLVRVEFTSLREQATTYAATFSYGDVEPITLPASGERGTLLLHQGLGPGTVHPPPP